MNRMQAYLSFADMVSNIGWMLGTSIVSNVPFCTFVGLIFEFNAVLSTCYIFCISVLGYITVTRGSKSAEALKWWYFGYALGVPVVFTIVLVVTTSILQRGNMIGDATFECWISDAYPELKVALLYPLVWLHMVALSIIYSRIYFLILVTTSELEEISEISGRSSSESHPLKTMANKTGLLLSPAKGAGNTISRNETVNTKGDLSISRVGDQLRSGVRKKMLKSTNRLVMKATLIAISFVVSWTPATITRILQLLGAPVPFWLWVSTAICFSLMGLLNSSVFLVMFFLKL
ncbi:hypothetical protein BC830DRAFT_445933 [Chytriomyces sp. MP71]|nr:hypothetical protein BC830DRAFT_445933 [Chytriomyces sp. MP71]